MAELKNKRQEMFCRHYITEIDGEAFNATKAAIKAGYSEKTATPTASRLLTYVNIQERIAELQQEAFKRCEMDADYVLTRYKRIIDDDIKNYLSFRTEEVIAGIEEDEEGNKKAVYTEQLAMRIKDSDNIDTWNISEVSIGKDGQFKFKLHCKDNALRDVGKHLKMFTDKVESTNVNHNLNDDVSELSEEELDEKIRKLQK